MPYCLRHGEHAYPCYPSQCTDESCDYRRAALQWYFAMFTLADDIGVHWCDAKCTQPCEYKDLGALCDDEIERLIDHGVSIEDVLGVDLSCLRNVLNLAAYRISKMIDRGDL